jgi:hypothetical protein
MTKGRQRKKCQKQRLAKQAARKSGNSWRKTLDPSSPSAEILRKAWASAESVALASELRNKILKKFPRLIDSETGADLVGVIEAPKAWESLELLHDLLVSRVRELVADRGSADWLWFLRRLRGQFHVNNLETTDPYIQALAETLAAGDSRPSAPLAHPSRFAFPVTEEAVYDVHWISQMAILLYQLHGTMKRCAKGQPIQFFPGALPQPSPHPELESAIDSYDRRTQRMSSNLLQAVGLVAQDEFTPLDSRDDPRIGGLVPHWFFLASRRGRPLDKADPPPAILKWIDFDRIPPFREQGILNDEHAALIYLLWACFNIATRDSEMMTRRLSATLQWGYMVTSTDQSLLRALDEIAMWVPQARGAALRASTLPNSGSDVLNMLHNIAPVHWPPLCGNPVHEAGAYSVIDLAGASRRLNTTLVRPADGADVNYWSKQFEKDVQSLIDASPWRPEGSIRDLIGRSIRRPDGSEVTDIDAVGYRDKRLLLVSCKSIAFTLPALGGEHRVTRNITEKVNKAAEEWMTVVELVRADRSRLGPPAPSEARIDGCVVFPAVPFSTDRRWRFEIWRGLPYLLSSAELALALDGR